MKIKSLSASIIKNKGRPSPFLFLIFTLFLLHQKMQHMQHLYRLFHVFFLIRREPILVSRWRLTFPVVEFHCLTAKQRDSQTKKKHSNVRSQKMYDVSSIKPAKPTGYMECKYFIKLRFSQSNRRNFFIFAPFAMDQILI